LSETQPQSTKRLGWKAWTAIAIAGLAIIGALGGGSEDSADRPDGDGAAQPAQSPSGDATAEATPDATPRPEVRVRVSSPSIGATVRKPRVTVRGTVTPRTARVKVDGRRVEVRRGRFAHTVSLDVGRNLVLFEATARLRALRRRPLGDPQAVGGGAR
jgi:hypothetical protein